MACSVQTLLHTALQTAHRGSCATAHPCGPVCCNQRLESRSPTLHALRARNAGRSRVVCDSLDRNTAETANSQQPGPSDPVTQPVRDRRYFEGLLRSNISQNYGASSTDMLLRSLQLAGGAAAVLMLLTYGFLASNGLAPGAQ